MQQKQLTIEELSKKLKPILGNKIDEIYFKYVTSESIEERTEIVQLLTALYQKHLSKLLDQKVLLEPPQKQVVSGDYPLAKVVYNDRELFEFGLNEKDWPRHVCISGMSGSGKTTFAFGILKNFIQKNKPFLVFDWKKSFRPLMNQDSSIMAFTIGNEAVSNLFKMNINRPPKGVSPKEWINVLCDLLTESFCVSFGVHKVLLETLDEIFEKWGIYNGFDHYPNWMHVKKMLEIKARDSKGRETKWYESALRIATVLTFGNFGKVINYDGKKSLSIEELFDKKVVFELSSLGNIEKKFFCEFVLTYVYKLKKAKENKIDEKFNYAIVVDEAHNIFLKNKTNFLSESVTDMIYREMREYGISLICLDQHISKLSDTVKGNSACHVAFQQQLPEDIRDASLLMQLGDSKETFSKISVGSAIVKLSERHNSPFLIKVPFVDLRNQSITDEKIAQRMNCLIKAKEVREDPEFENALVAKENIISESTEKSSENTEMPKINQKIIKVQEPKEINQEIPLQEIPEVQEIKINMSEKNLNQTQEVLFNFINKNLDQGKTLTQIEKLLENGLFESQYSQTDILTSINFALNKKLNEQKQIFEKAEEQINNIPKDITEDQKRFISFLSLNPNHKHNTIELYKKISFSARKGNQIKKQLMEKQLIKVEEQKNSRGWQKFIRLSQ